MRFAAEVGGTSGVRHLAAYYRLTLDCNVGGERVPTIVITIMSNRWYVSLLQLCYVYSYLSVIGMYSPE